MNTKYLISFNSKMVQLKVIQEADDKPVYPGFNSKMVQLKALMK